MRRPVLAYNRGGKLAGVEAETAQYKLTSGARGISVYRTSDAGRHPIKVYFLRLGR